MTIYLDEVSQLAQLDPNMLDSLKKNVQHLPPHQPLYFTIPKAPSHHSWIDDAMTPTALFDTTETFAISPKVVDQMQKSMLWEMQSLIETQQLHENMLKNLYSGRFGEQRAERQVPVSKIVAAMEQVVARKGEHYRDLFAKTTIVSGDRDTSGEFIGPVGRCIQGELLVELGLADKDAKPGEPENIPSVASGVIRLLGHSSTGKVAAALHTAQMLNDDEHEWGKILTVFKRELGLAA